MEVEVDAKTFSSMPKPSFRLQNPLFYRWHEVGANVDNRRQGSGEEIRQKQMLQNRGPEQRLLYPISQPLPQRSGGLIPSSYLSVGPWRYFRGGWYHLRLPKYCASDVLDLSCSLPPSRPFVPFFPLSPVSFPQVFPFL